MASWRECEHCWSLWPQNFAKCPACNKPAAYRWTSGSDDSLPGDINTKEEATAAQLTRLAKEKSEAATAARAQAIEDAMDEALVARFLVELAELPEWDPEAPRPQEAVPHTSADPAPTEG